MTIEEAKIKFKKIMEAEWDRLPSHYDSEIGEEVFDDTNQVDELLKLNKIICAILDKQIPQKPSQDSIDGLNYFLICPNCHEGLEGYETYCECGQVLDWSDIDDI